MLSSVTTVSFNYDFRKHLLFFPSIAPFENSVYAKSQNLESIVKYRFKLFKNILCKVFKILENFR